MRPTALWLLPSFLSIAQARNHNRWRKWERRQEISSALDGDSEGATNCVPQTVTETLQQTTIVTAAGVAEGENATTTVTVTMTAFESSQEDGFNAKKFEGLSFITTTQTETIVATAAAETLTVVQPASTVIQVVTASAPPAVTLVQTVTQAVTEPAVTLIQTVTEAGQAPPPVTVTETIPVASGVSATNTGDGAQNTVSKPGDLPNGIGVGVSTVPIPNSRLPTTTFGADPLATSSEVPSPPPVINTSALTFGSPPPADTTQPQTSSVISSAGETQTTAAVSSEIPTSSVAETGAETSAAETSAAETSSIETSAVPDVSSSPASESTSKVDTTSSTPTSTLESAVVSTTATTTAESITDETSTSKPESSTAPASSSRRTMESAITIVPTSTTTTTAAAAIDTGVANPGSSLDLGGLQPHATAGRESAVTGTPTETAKPVLADSPIRSLINMSELTFRSEVDLGNLLGATAPGSQATRLP